MSFSAASLRAALELWVPERASGLVVALSGGADSASLLKAAAALGAQFRALPLRAVHVDHGLQASATRFRRACEGLCRQLDVPLRIVSVHVHCAPGTSVEAAARDARYAALAAELKAKECLLTAHHRLDQAETILLQALRGAGVKGLSAMPSCREFGAGWHVRPVLDVPREELLKFGADLGVADLTDPMNEDPRFDRSFLRKKIWPMIAERWPGAELALSRTARHLAQAQEQLDLSAAADVAHLRDGEALSVTGLRALTPAKRVNVVRYWLNEAGAETPSTARLNEALRQVLGAAEDHQPAIVWGRAALRRYRHRLFLTEADPPRLEDERLWGTAREDSVDLGDRLGRLTWRPQLGGLAPEALPRVLKVRRRVGGETLKPARSADTHTVQHLCQSLGVLPWMRDALPLVFAGEALIAVADLWMDARWCAATDAPGLSVAWNSAPQVI
jgi:tRNA(Ile)-lysidine synthase